MEIHLCFGAGRMKSKRENAPRRGLLSSTKPNSQSLRGSRSADQESGLAMCTGQRLVKRVSRPAEGGCRRMFGFGSLVDFGRERTKDSKARSLVPDGPEQTIR